MSDYKYRQELVEAVMKNLRDLHPKNFETKSEVREQCPNCHDDEGAFFRLPEFKYGRCTECHFEYGLDYYHTVIANRIEEYEFVVARVKDAFGVK